MVIINNILDVIKYINDIKVIVFDLDDTLYNEIDYMISGFRKVVKYLNDNYKINIDIENAIKEMKKSYYLGEKPINKLLNDYNLYNEENINKCLNVYREHIPEIVLDKAIKNMLCDFKENNKKLGIITDGRPEGQKAKIKALNIEKLFDYIIITDEIGGVEYRKPNKISYDMMKEHFGVRYEEMCYVGDNIKKDFIYPEKIGIKSIYYINNKSIIKK